MQQAAIKLEKKSIERMGSDAIYFLLIISNEAKIMVANIQDKAALLYIVGRNIKAIPIQVNNVAIHMGKATFSLRKILAKTSTKIGLVKPITVALLMVIWVRL